jgi:capsid assembly protease
MSRAIDWIFDHRWAITPSALDNIIALASNEEMISRAIKEAGLRSVEEAIESKDSKPMEKTRRATIRDGVAILNITGPIFPRANLFTMISGATSVQMLAADFGKILEDQDAYAIALNIDSPGGEVTGVSELANMIYAARDKKPVYAYVYGMGASAAYWLATSASKVFIADTAEVGSIGVVAAYQDAREKDQKSGIKTHEIISSRSPNKRPDPATDAGRAQIQAIVDSIAEVFIAAVARNRGINVGQVISNFGAGGMMVGATAVAAGMADQVSSLEEVIGILKDDHERSKRNIFPLFAGAKGVTMDFSELKVKHPAVYQQALDEGKAAGSAEATAAAANARTEGLEEGKKLGAAAERARIQAIESLSNFPGAAAIINGEKFKPEATKESVSVLIVEKSAAAAAAATAATEKDALKLAKGLKKIASTPEGGMDGTGEVGEQAVNDSIIKAATEKANANRK